MIQNETLRSVAQEKGLCRSFIMQQKMIFLLPKLNETPEGSFQGFSELETLEEKLVFVKAMFPDLTSSCGRTLGPSSNPQNATSGSSNDHEQKRTLGGDPSESHS
mmetsp:Transcript_35033/g.69147  ORF Transcript_35033/g.69147 Transcript_35033/m.69147 type:complete len:105 (-) Transcript_35033:539-853(-)